MQPPVQCLPEPCIVPLGGVEVTFRLTVGQSVCGGVEPTLGRVTRYYVLSEGRCVVSVGRPL
jgi:hypothetical protein